MKKTAFRTKSLLILTAFGCFIALIIPSVPPVEAAAKNCLDKAASKPSLKVSGNKASASLTIPKNCVNQKVTIASYKAPNGTDGKPYSQQKIYRWSSYTYTKAGRYTIKLAVPDCYYQVDLARGGVIQDFSPGNTYAQQGRLLASAHGGNKSCTPKPAPAPAPAPTPAPAPVAPPAPAPQPVAPIVSKPEPVAPPQRNSTLSCVQMTVVQTSQAGVMPASYRFKPAMSGQTDGTKQYSYDFGDGNTKQTSGSMAEHTYSKPGTYNAEMTTPSNTKQGDTVSCNTSVVVKNEAPPVAPAATAQEPAAPQQQAAPVAAETETPSQPQQESAPEVTSSKLPDTGPGEVAAFGFVWTFMGSILFAYRGKMDSIVATVVSRLG